LATYTHAIPTEVPVIRFDAPVIFTNTELLKSCIRDAVRARREHIEEKSIELSLGPQWMAVVLDCRSWTHTDAMGVDAIREINEEMLNKEVLLIFANLNSMIRIQYARAGLFKTLREHQFCPSIDDGLIVAEKLQSNSQAFFQVEKEETIGVM
ncbi:STAS domain protein, partial [Oesophagostomum dentatum]